MLPASADPEIISAIIGMSSAGGGWRKIAHIEGLRILEQKNQESASNIDVAYDSLSVSQIAVNAEQIKSYCRKAQIVIHQIPVNVFIAVMETPSPCWPRNGAGTTKVLKVIDDHADLIQVKVTYGKWGSREFTLSRFWKLDDDGTYLITYNTSAANDLQVHLACNIYVLLLLLKL